MPNENARDPGTETQTTKQSYRWSDLDNLGLPRDHFYRAFLEIARSACLNCGHHHLTSKRVILAKGQCGTEWQCSLCHQYWCSPNLIPARRRARSTIRGRPPKTRQFVGEVVITETATARISESHTERITEYK